MRCREREVVILRNQVTLVKAKLYRGAVPRIPLTVKFNLRKYRMSWRAFVRCLRIDAILRMVAIETPRPHAQPVLVAVVASRRDTRRANRRGFYG